MDKGDLLTFIGGFAVILVVAVIANPGLLAIHSSPGSPVPGAPTQPVTTDTPVTPAITAAPQQTPAAGLTPVPPYRIVYTSNPFTYPVVRLPDHMETFGASDVNRETNMIPFAYVEESRGGITDKFSVPYGMWGLNISVTADRKPQYAIFRMVLCDSAGRIITGSEIQYPGRTYKSVHASGTGLYMIISTTEVDSFRISLETPERFYNSTAALS